ncbi:hypothetical protein [Phaeocystidibacter marisrubri]|uniref:hypothetical protein n=1 Tax=Phaeocystidibacter marisrubri TaxID=1577780 RepID=UPI00124CD6DA|nr:hypothetical protein [Phaeocystidibacter marisrubri]GGH69878.1 hypothetical protein GCM10011318_11360 [Phaeocystidibacter marisrubri]
MGGHIDGTLLQSGARTAAEVIGGIFFDSDEHKTFGGSGEAKLSDIFHDSPDHIIQSYMIQTFGNEEPKANYQSNE